MRSDTFAFDNIVKGNVKAFSIEKHYNDISISH